MPSNRRRRQSSSGGGGAPAWMNTYGDMVTLLLAFFIMLFAFSNLDVDKFRAIMSAFQGAIGVLDGGTTVSRSRAVTGADSPRAELMLRNPMELEETQDVLQSLTTFQREQNLQDAFTLEATERGVVIHFTDRVLFDVGKAELKPEAATVLDMLTLELAGRPNHIRVEGHTDNFPIETSLYPSNWELSTARAARVIRFFVDEGGLPPDRLSAAGYGEYRPISPNGSAEGRARNRRVDIVLLKSELTAAEPTATLRL